MLHSTAAIFKTKKLSEPFFVFGFQGNFIDSPALFGHNSLLWTRVHKVVFG
jgi:hypothetical protein